MHYKWKSRLGLIIVALAVIVVISLRQSSGPVPSSSLPNPESNTSLSVRAWDTCIAGNPYANIPTNEYPNSFNPSQVINTPDCNAAVLTDINRRHAIEGYRPMTLPSDFGTLSPPEQLITVVNAERVSRHLPPYKAMLLSLDQDALRAANAGIDPNPSKADGNWTQYNSIWAGGYQTVLMADFDWMYNDGWGGSSSKTINVDCKSAKAKTCWGHRQVILAPYTLEPGDVLVAGGAVVTTGPSSLAVPSWAAAFESVPVSDVKNGQTLAP